MKGACHGCHTIKGVRPETKPTCGQIVVTVHSSNANRFCTILFVRMFYVPMTLHEKTQNRVLGPECWSALRGSIWPSLTKVF